MGSAGPARRGVGLTARLFANSSRMAVDPVSGKAVDKATATIGATPDGQVLYLESPETLARYGKRPQRGPPGRVSDRRRWAGRCP